MLERKRNILMLIAQYLTDTGLVNAAEILGKECGLLAAASREYSLCDNVDLESIYLDYMSYHQLKFGRPPRIAKRSDSAAGGGGPHDPAAKKPSTAATAGRRRQQQQLQRSSVLRAEMDSANEKLLARDSCLGDTLQVSPCLGQAAAAGDQQQQQQQPTACLAAVPLLRMHPNFAPEWAAMAETICRDIVDGAALNVSWQSLKGHRTAKDKLVESVLTPLQYPHLFADPTSVGPLRLRPWKCILLHGPPGTGKTSLARALCRETAGRATFFNVSASTMVSKWRGESEKLVRVLFDVAKYYAPSIVFVDEVEGLMSRRDSSADHEASKRFKNELLTHIDGLDEMHNVFVLGSTNLPWYGSVWSRTACMRNLNHLCCRTQGTRSGLPATIRTQAAAGLAGCGRTP